MSADVLSEHVVYRLYDSERLIYIGATYNLPLRLQQHRHGTPWFSDVVRVESQTYPNRRAAFTAEAAAIRAEQPPRNLRHTSRYAEPRLRKDAAA